MKDAKNHQKHYKCPILAILTSWMGLCGKNNMNLCPGQVSGHSEAKSINKIFFFVFAWKLMIFQKKFQRPQNPPFWAQKSSWMGSPCGFSSKLVELSKKWILKKVYRKCVKLYWHGLLKHLLWIQPNYRKLAIYNRSLIITTLKRNYANLCFFFHFRGK